MSGDKRIKMGQITERVKEGGGNEIRYRAKCKPAWWAGKQVRRRAGGWGGEVRVI